MDISCPFKLHLHLFFHKWKQSSGQNCKRDFTASFVLEGIKPKMKYINKFKKKKKAPPSLFPTRQIGRFMQVTEQSQILAVGSKSGYSCPATL